MTDNEPSIDLSDDQHTDEYLAAVATVADVLAELADIDSVPPEDREELMLSMEDIAATALAELDLKIIQVNDDGTVLASIRPLGIES